MIDFDEDALICDLAETYNIYDYRSLPLLLVATLSAGLRENSRIKFAMAGSPVSQDTLILASIADRIEAFRYMMSSNKTSTPAFIVDALLKKEKKTNGVTRFKSGEELEAALAKIRGD